VVQLKALTSETIETLNQRVSVRDYSDKPLDDATVLTILNAARRTATSSNTQTYSFIVVRDAETKQTLSVLAGHQKHIVTCPVFIAVCRSHQAANFCADT
jgi:nitroreductase